MTLRKSGEKGLWFGIIAIFVGLSGCDDGGTGPNNNPAFSDFTGIIAGNTYVAYTSPNPALNPDTIRFSFNYNASLVSSMVVKATIDSGRSWIYIAKQTLTNSGKVSIEWVPKNNSKTTFNYFGFKKCYVWVEDTVTGHYLKSDIFKITGSAAFGNLTGLNNNLFYVAYMSPDRLSKLDSVRFSIEYNSSLVTAITVEATIDSGRTWYLVAKQTPSNTGQCSVVWIPRDAAQTTFNYFGFKKCSLRILDTINGHNFNSDTITIIGAAPINLIAPGDGETFKKADSLKIIFSQNQDISSKITVCSKAGPDTVDFVCDSGTQVRISQTLPIKTWTTTIVPQVLAEKFPENFDFTYPLKILLADYGPNGKRLTSGAITIE
jgi:hypothetical protein